MRTSCENYMYYYLLGNTATASLTGGFVFGVRRLREEFLPHYQDTYVIHHTWTSTVTVVRTRLAASYPEVRAYKNYGLRLIIITV